MSETTTEAQAVTAEAAEEGTTRTFTQDELNRFIAADRRKDRESMVALQNEVVALREKASKLDSIEAEQMTAVEKATRERDELENRLAEIEKQAKAAERERLASSVAVKVAEELGVPVAAALKLAGKLDGEDDEALTASAKDLFELLRPAAPAVPAAVNDNIGGPADDFEAGLLKGMQRLKGVTK